MTQMPCPRMDCAVDAAMSVFEGRWKSVILCRMMREDRPLRFKELAEGIDGISARILTKQLKEMESDHLIVRREYAESPPRVEYSLTERGRSLGPILKAIAEWGRENMFLNRVTFDVTGSPSD
ncbi:MAG: helix-turn-helix transcriptional regulator [Candidatus Methanomethylophilaceae archaeon]|nr:helix-turn-helix transcriptional regulator [Candidatus Methanomethylophilaceae archaeon]